ncbi:MAG: nitroreductase family deazaflavin-dependent oxidoreductase [Acidimicrobiales bacterium]
MSEPSDFNSQIIAEFRSNQGRVGGQFAGAPLLLLTTTGAKTGQGRTSPVMYANDGDRLVIFASKAGSPTNPAWYHNLVAHSRGRVEVGTDTFEVDAAVAEGQERHRLWQRQTEAYPGFAEYQEKTTRQIPVVILQRVS